MSNKNEILHYWKKSIIQYPIARMYADLKIILKIGKAKAETKQTIGARQGDCMAPVLLLFMMMVFAVALEK